MINLSRAQFYAIINNPEIDIEYLLKIGKAIGVDFSKQVPELKRLDVNNALAVSEGVYKVSSATEPDDELLELQRKYIHVLEDNILLRKELRQYETGKLLPKFS